MLHLILILTRDIILKEIKDGNVKITPFTKQAVGPASVDLTLSNEFRILKFVDAFHVKEDITYGKISYPIKTKTYRLKPGDTVLGITKEKITLPQDICGWLQGRSRFARLGLVIHITASFVQPGSNNKQILEIYNAGPAELILHAGTKICQIILERCEGKAKYTGKFRLQKKV